MATHSGILAWIIPWTEELSRLQFMGFQTVRHEYSSLYMSIPVSQLPLLPLPPSSHKFIFYICNCFSVVDKFICTIFLKIPCVSDTI